MVPEWQDEDQASVSGNLVMHQESTWVLDDHIVSHSPSDSANEVVQLHATQFVLNVLKQSIENST